MLAGPRRRPEAGLVEIVGPGDFGLTSGPERSSTGAADVKNSPTAESFYGDRCARFARRRS